MCLYFIKFEYFLSQLYIIDIIIIVILCNVIIMKLAQYIAQYYYILCLIRTFDSQSIYCKNEFYPLCDGLKCMTKINLKLFGSIKKFT